MATWILAPRDGQCCACNSAPCDSCLCGLTLDTAGGDAGYSQTFTINGGSPAGGNISVSFETFTIKDRLIITADGTTIYDSGCISGTVTPTVGIPGGTTSVTVTVIPNCEGTVGTAWTLSITC